MESVELQAVLEKHKQWLNNEEGGERANLWNADLGNADLRDADLRDADLRNANLWNADLGNANLRNANLWNADLRDADLRDADLRGADLRDAAGNLKQIKSLFIEQYVVVYTADYLHIGCERHTISDWWDFDDKRILEMDGKSALKFWRKWKEYLQKTIELSPAEPTKAENSEERVKVET